MFEKPGKFYADWRDRGARKRKSFTTASAALRFEEERALSRLTPEAQSLLIVTTATT